MDAVLDAATELVADRGPNAVTVRAIAERAGVNHALVHRYFGTKDELIGAVIDREVARFKAIAGEGDPSQTFPRMLGALSERRIYVRFLARSILDGYRSSQLRPDFLLFGQVRDVVEAAQARDAGSAAPDMRVPIVALGSMALGWRIFGEFLASGLGLDTMPQEQLDAAIDGFITSVLLAPPGGRPPETGAP